MYIKHIIYDGKKLKYGFTTGSCAAACAKAASHMLYKQEKINTISIDTPKGWIVDFNLKNIRITKNYTRCAVIKYAGSDPDITDGIKIYVRVEKINDDKIIVEAGKGIGVVTKKGLLVDVGKPAINPVPMKMIHNEVKKVLPDGYGVKIIISIPDGKKIAKKTFNPRLGIVGGISILGTSGIVEPMSHDALKESLRLELSILKEKNIDSIIFVQGNYGKKIATGFGLNNEIIIQVSNFIGYMLERSIDYKIKKILIIGHPGKLIKLLIDVFDTHSKKNSNGVEILADQAKNFVNEEVLNRIKKSNTIEEAITYIKDNLFFKYIADKIKEKSMDYVKNKIDIEVIIFSMKNGFLAKTDNADNFIEIMSNKK